MLRCAIGACRAVHVRDILVQLPESTGNSHKMECVAIHFLSYGYCRYSQEVAQGCIRAFVNQTADDLKIGRGETESSETQVMTYPYCVGILKHSPPTIYHGQGLAWGSHTGPW